MVFDPRGREGGLLWKSGKGDVEAPSEPHGTTQEPHLE